MEINLQAIEELARKYPNMETLFDCLPEDIKRHGVRVAEYTQVMYNCGVEVEINPFDEKSASERSAFYSRYMFLAGKYHDIGLLCMPEDSPLRRPDTKAPELSKDVEHVICGNILSDYYAKANHYQPEMLWRMLGETLRSHHEKYDGTGFPDRLMTDQMPLSAWIVSIAVMLDVETAYPYTEHPFKEGFQRMIDFIMENKLNEMELVLRVSESKLERIFNKHISESHVITYKPLMIRRTMQRPMFFNYLKVCNQPDGNLVAFQAIPVFRQKARKEKIYLDEMNEKLKEAKISGAIWKYFLYEASDMRVRMNAYGLGNLVLQIPVLPGVITSTKIETFIEPWLKDTKTDITKYYFMVEPDMILKPTKTFTANINKLTEYGAKIMLVDFTGEEPYKYEDLGVKIEMIQFSSAILDRMDENIMGIIADVTASGIALQAGGIDSDDYKELLESMHVKQICEDFTDEYKEDDAILVKCCALKNNF